MGHIATKTERDRNKEKRWRKRGKKERRKTGLREGARGNKK